MQTFSRRARREKELRNLAIPNVELQELHPVNDHDIIMFDVRFQPKRGDTNLGSFNESKRDVHCDLIYGLYEPRYLRDRRTFEQRLRA